MQTAQKNDIGTVLDLTIRDQNSVIVDVSEATTLQIILLKPDGVRLTKTAELVNSGSDGLIRYEFVSGDLDTKGIWRFQAYIVLSGNEWYTTIGKFKVIDNL